MKVKLILFFLMIGFLLKSQPPIIQLKAQEDTFLIGKPFKVELLIQHDGSKTFEFLDVEESQSKFEIVSKQFFQTKKLNEKLYQDSVLLTLRSFSIEDSVLLWVTLFHKTGSDTVFLNSNSFWIKQKGAIIGGENDKLIFFHEYLKIEKKPDVFLYVSIMILIGVGLVIFMLFGFPKIMSKRKRKRFVKQHEEFIFDTKQIIINDKKDLDRMMSMWKKDLRLSTGINYDSYTINQLSNEIIALKDTFLTLEALLYSQDKLSEKTTDTINSLLTYSENQYNKKLETWK